MENKTLSNSIMMFEKGLAFQFSYLEKKVFEKLLEYIYSEDLDGLLVNAKLYLFKISKIAVFIFIFCGHKFLTCFSIIMLWLGSGLVENGLDHGKDLYL